MAEALLERESLDGADIDAIVRQVGAETRAPRPRRPEPARRTGRRSWTTRSGPVALDRPVLVGVLNATPDSFCDGGLHLDPARAAATACEMVAAGAAVLDLGGGVDATGRDARVGCGGATAAAAGAGRPSGASSPCPSRSTRPRRPSPPRRWTPAPTS